MSAAWRRVAVVVWADLRQLLRQKMAPVLMGVMVLSGVGMAVGSTRLDPALLLPVLGVDTETKAPPAPVVLCGGGPPVAVHGALPDYVPVPGKAVEPGHPGAVVELEWVPGETDDGELLLWKGAAGHRIALDRVETCLRMHIRDEWLRRHRALGFTHSRADVLRVRRHGPVEAQRRPWDPRLRWLRPDLPSNLDFFEVMAAIFAMLLVSGQAVDGVLRNRVSGWEETLGTVGLTGPERVVGRVLSAWVLSLVVMGLVTLGGLLAGPVVGWVVSPVRWLVALLAPMALGVLLVTVTRGAVDVRSATARSVLPFAFTVYAAAGALVMDMVWVPVGGPLVLAVLGGDTMDWLVGTVCTVVPMLGMLVWASRGVPHVRTPHGDRSASAERHARGRFGPEAVLLCALAFWAIVVLPLSAATNLVAAHLIGQLVGLGGVALLSPVALGLPVRQTLGLRRPTARSWLASVLLPLGTLPLMLGLVRLQVDLGWVSPVLLRSLEKFGEESLGPLAEPFGGVLVWAVPGTMEELMMRGAVLGLLLPRGHWPRSRLRTVLAVVAQAVVFGGLHLLAVRWLPTAAMGLVLGVFAVRSRSILPGMVTHMLHNLVAVQVLASVEHPWLEDPWLLGGMALLTVPLVLWATPAMDDASAAS